MIAIWSCGNRLIVRDLPGFAYWTIVALSANAASAIVMPMSARMASSRLASGCDESHQSNVSLVVGAQAEIRSSFSARIRAP